MLGSQASCGGPLVGRRGLVLGLANEHSIAWGCAREAARQGARLVLTCLNERAHAVCEPLAREIDAPLLCCDVQAPGALSGVVQQAAQHLSGLDFAVHSIAWAPLADLHGRVTDSSPDGFARAMEVSCHSFAELARCCEPFFARAQGGTLITMSYHGAVESVPHYGLMGPVKAALEALVRYLAVELGPRNVRVHAVSPGPVPTRAAGGLEDFDGLMADARARSPLRRLVSLQEIGGLTAFLVSDAASGMTGQTLYVDAGHHIAR